MFKINYPLWRFVGVFGVLFCSFSVSSMFFWESILPSVKSHQQILELLLPIPGSALLMHLCCNCRWARPRAGGKDILLKLEQLEKKVTGHDQDIQMIFETLKQLLDPQQEPHPRIGYRRSYEKD